MRILFSFLLVATISFASPASALIVSFSGSGSGGSVSGGFSWDPNALGATADRTMVALTDPGISNFQFNFSSNLSTGVSSGTINGVSIASGFNGTFNLTPVAISSSIVNSFICLEDTSGGLGVCNPANPVTVFSFNPGNISVTPAGANSSFSVAPVYSVVEPVSQVPLPGALGLLLTALAGLGFLGRKSLSPA